MNPQIDLTQAILARQSAEKRRNDLETKVSIIAIVVIFVLFGALFIYNFGVAKGYEIGVRDGEAKHYVGGGL